VPRYADTPGTEGNPRENRLGPALIVVIPAATKLREPSLARHRGRAHRYRPARRIGPAPGRSREIAQKVAALGPAATEIERERGACEDARVAGEGGERLIVSVPIRAHSSGGSLELQAVFRRGPITAPCGRQRPSECGCRRTRTRHVHRSAVAAQNRTFKSVEMGTVESFPGFVDERARA
jgi:hypothetical protein